MYKRLLSLLSIPKGGPLRNKQKKILQLLCWVFLQKNFTISLKLSIFITALLENSTVHVEGFCLRGMTYMFDEDFEESTEFFNKKKKKHPYYKEIPPIQSKDVKQLQASS